MPAVNPSFVSIDMNLSYNSTTYASPTLAVVNCRDVNLGLNWGEADVANRGINLALFEPTLQVRELEFDMIIDETDVNYAAIRNKALTRGIIELWMANGPIGTSGTVASGGTANIVYNRCQWKMFSMKRGEPFEGSPTMTFTLKPCKANQIAGQAPTDNGLIA